MMAGLANYQSFGFSTFDDLAHYLADWYDAHPAEFALSKAAVAGIANPILQDFYRKFGALAEPDTRFKNPKSHCRPFSAQDTILPVGELQSKDGYTVFGVENQGVFVIAAAESNDAGAYAAGDCIAETTVEMTSVNVPLMECLITFALGETIFSVYDTKSSLTEAEALQQAQTGLHVRSAYLWQEAPTKFYLTPDLWLMDRDGMIFFAEKDQWQRAN